MQCELFLRSFNRLIDKINGMIDSSLCFLNFDASSLCSGKFKAVGLFIAISRTITFYGEGLEEIQERVSGMPLIKYPAVEVSNAALVIFQSDINNPSVG